MVRYRLGRLSREPQPGNIGRALVYIWTTSGDFVNEDLLLHGSALRETDQRAGTLHSGRLNAAQVYARKAGRTPGETIANAKPSRSDALGSFVAWLLILTLLLAWFLWRVWRTRSGKSARVRELFHARRAQGTLGPIAPIGHESGLGTTLSLSMQLGTREWRTPPAA